MPTIPNKSVKTDAGYGTGLGLQSKVDFPSRLKMKLNCRLHVARRKEIALSKIPHLSV